MKKQFLAAGALVTAITVPFAASAEEVTVTCDDGETTLTVRDSSHPDYKDVGILRISIPNTPYPSIIDGDVNEAGQQEVDLYVQDPVPNDPVQNKRVDLGFYILLENHATSIAVDVAPYYESEDGPAPRQITCPIPGR